MQKPGDNTSHWLFVCIHFVLDALIVAASLGLAAAVRFQDWLPPKAIYYIPSVVAAAITFPSLVYISGLYARHRFGQSGIGRTLKLALCLAGALLIIFAIGSLNFSARVGRGVLLLGFPVAIALAAAHHVSIHRNLSRSRITVASLVGSSEDENTANLFENLGQSHARHIGLVSCSAYTPSGPSPLLGTLDNLGSDSGPKLFSSLLVRDRHLSDPSIAPLIRRLRYAGVHVTSLADACEDVFFAVPLELVNESWLARASWQPGLFYVKKLKRAFDIATSILFGLLLSAPLALGIFAVRLSSRGPVFFTQTRCGRLGKVFTVYKLRTMRTDAEVDGARWSTRKDPRIIPVGRFLRRFRIDEIPQLFNVLRGEMSFVGPRPERPEFVSQLAEEIPHYKERLLIQPGLTGWAQVRYPYGADTNDARRKLEFDLYYLKHMSIVLDLFILLDTVRIILRGGAIEHAAQHFESFRNELRDTGSRSPSPLPSEQEANPAQV